MRRLRAAQCMEGLYVYSGLTHIICHQNVFGLWWIKCWCNGNCNLSQGCATKTVKQHRKDAMLMHSSTTAC